MPKRLALPLEMDSLESPGRPGVSLDRHLREAEGRHAQEEPAEILAVAVRDRVAGPDGEAGTVRDRREHGKRTCHLTDSHPEQADGVVRPHGFIALLSRQDCILQLHYRMTSNRGRTSAPRLHETRIGLEERGDRTCETAVGLVGVCTSTIDRTRRDLSDESVVIAARSGPYRVHRQLDSSLLELDPIASCI